MSLNQSLISDFSEYYRWSQRIKIKYKLHYGWLSPRSRPLSQYFNTDRSKAVLLLWFLTVTCSCCLYLYFGSAIMLVAYFSKF